MPSPIPIIGQAVEVTAWFLTVQAVCKCGQSGPMLMVGVPGGMQGQCPSCKGVWVLTGMRIDGDAVSYDFGRKA
jgi:hypothetical protein